MTRVDFIREMDQQVKLVRAEYGYNQEQMARVLGLSKKTLVEIEKGRSTLGWMGAVALCALFRDSRVLSGTLGGEGSDMIAALAFTEQPAPHYPKTMGGKVWWRTVESRDGYRIQQNIISQHYRLLNGEDCRICASFELDAVRQRLEEEVTEYDG